ncbi:MAG: DoxX family protein [Candidatus Competibacter sp.]|nr:DoxX family protein [Candidatus Competibacter sp.]
MRSSKSSQLSAPTGKVRLVSWGLRILAAAAFLAAGGAKLAGVPMMVGIFDQIGFGQWFREVTGLVEVIGGIAILLPATVAFGGLLLATTMVLAVLTHLFLIGGSPVPALVLLLITATVAWLHRASFALMLGQAARA